MASRMTLRFRVVFPFRHGLSLPLRLRHYKIGSMQWWQYLLWVLAIVVVAYLGGFLYVFSCLTYFSRRLKKRMVALSVLFAEKKEVLGVIYTAYKKASVTFEEADEEAATKVRWLVTETAKGQKPAAIAAQLDEMEKRLNYLAENNQWLRQGDDYKTLGGTLHDLDANYRKIVAAYNSDLSGYEYWRKFFLYRFWFWIFGVKAKKPLA
jgi:hypothetical protein